jgi:uncharacterized protein involved in exopolysaccharide biosynthesis
MDDTEDNEESRGGGFQIELIKSYLSFVRRAIRLHWVMLVSILAVGVTLTIVIYQYIPRRFNCVTVLTAEQNQVLDSFGAPHPFSGASTMIMRHDNLEALVKETKLVEKFEARRPPILKLKDQLIEKAFGKFSDDVKLAIQVGSLESRLGVGINGDGNLSISADWTDGLTASEVAEAARESFLRNRRNAETAAFQEKLAILDGHGKKLRQEMESLAEQIKSMREQRLAEANKKNAPTATAGTPAPAAAAAAIAPVAAARRAPQVDEQLPALREKLAEKKQKLARFDADREQRVGEEKRKLDELLLKFTPSHPEVVNQRARLAQAQQVPSSIALDRDEVTRLEIEIRQRDALKDQIRAGAGGARTPAATTPGVEPVPTNIVRLLAEEDADPLLSSQLSSAAVKYSMVQDEIRGTRIGLDTAQAAFNHRYKIVVPAEAPSKPYKPSPMAILGGGILFSLVLALLIPILLELRTGIIVERWQVQLVELPVLAELRLPPHSD